MHGPKGLQEPQASTKALAKAKAEGKHEQVKVCLEQKEREMRMASKRKLLPQEAASLLA